MTTKFRGFLIGMTLLACCMQLAAQGTAFLYQGRLNDGGVPANGTNYGMVFYLWDSPTNGLQLGDFGVPSVAVTNGLFSTPLNFGDVFDGNPRWLSISVQKNGGPFTDLTPREAILATPYAILAGTASNLVGALPASQLTGPISQAQLPGVTLTNTETNVNLSGSFSGTFSGPLANFNAQLPLTLSNLASQVATPLNLAGGTNFSAAQISSGTWSNASVNYAYKSFYTNYTIAATDTVLDCTGTNQVITLLPAANFPPTTLLTIWSDNVNGSVLITNGTGSEAITVPGQGQGLAIVLGPANSPSNSVTLMVHGGHW
jgi:hypothetical protein